MQLNQQQPVAKPDPNVPTIMRDQVAATLAAATLTAPCTAEEAVKRYYEIRNTIYTDHRR